MSVSSDNAAIESLIQKYRVRENLIGEFSNIADNEKQTEVQLSEKRELNTSVCSRDLDKFDIILETYCQRVYYISDLHLLHRLRNAHCESPQDVKNLLTHIAETIASEARGLLLINGDFSSDFSLFRMFVDILSHQINGRALVVFTLGNHEFWDFDGKSIDEIVETYRKVLSKYGMYLLHNDLLYRTETHTILTKRTVHIINATELLNSDEQILKDTLKKARTVIWGGTGFSGYNLEFNANNGIYRNVLNRKEEIQQSRVFEKTYQKLLPVIKGKNAIVMTHMPLSDWCKDSPQEGIYYLSGHTHKNIFYDDGAYHIYADNQIGYRNDSVHVKSFLMDNEYDLFQDYPDGIHKITPQQYRDFNRGKNIKMSFNRKIDYLWMLKKHGYYCFILESAKGKLYILNGGVPETLKHDRLDYYFENMDQMIKCIEEPLTKYTNLQKEIAHLIKKIGGNGKIHGCIIDIDFNNHIYVNPFDLTITGYWAEDIVFKKVYPSVPALLEENCPKYFKAYKELSCKKENAVSVLEKSEISEPEQLYLNTDIYKASREIRKMQRLQFNVLRTWYDNLISDPQKDNQPLLTYEKENNKVYKL
jgi:calcineurin-like phosphoesterase family protein